MRITGVPYFHKIFATCRKDPTVYEYKLCDTRFPYFLQNCMDDSHVDDTKFEDLGVPVDVDECGISLS